VLATTLQPLTYCKNQECREPITVKHVTQEREIEDAPQHIIIEFKCGYCTHEDKMVGTKKSWHDFLREEAEVDNADEKRERVMEIELGAINSAQDLINLWHSLRRAPLLEDRIGLCTCDECKRKLYGK